MTRAVWLLPSLFSFRLDLSRRQLSTTLRLPGARSFPRAPADVRWECIYRSIEECRPNVLTGNRGFCNPNPTSLPLTDRLHQSNAGARVRSRRGLTGLFARSDSESR